MKLSELLDELRENILHDRSDRTAGTSDYLWTDETLVRYINEAHRRFARRSFCILDGSTAEVVEVTLQTDVSQYVLHPSVLGVVSAKISTEDYDLQRVGHSLLDLHRPVSEDVWDLSQYAALPAGKVLAFTTDEQLGEDDEGTFSAVSLRVYPKPSATYNGTKLKLRVIRMPLDDLAASNLSQVPEIPRDHHIEMLDWAAYLALRIVDQDAGNPRRAAEFAQSFEQHVKDARTLVLRKLRAPQSWGFGRRGFGGYER